MILSSTTKEKIMNVRDYYEKREQEVDINFLEEVLNILQKEEKFKDTFQYEFIKDRFEGPAYTANKVSYFNINNFMKYIKKMGNYLFSEYPKKDSLKYYHFMALLTMFHECSHAWQQNELEDYSEINRLHHDVNCIREFPLRDILKNIRFHINLLRVTDHDFFERQANIDSYRELVDVYEQYDFLDAIKSQHIGYLAYRPIRESIVHDTLHKFLLEYNYNCEGIPEYLLFEVGLPTSKEYSLTAYDAIDKYCLDELPYKKVLEILKNGK